MKRIQKLDKIMVRYIILIAALALLIFNYPLIFTWIGRLWAVLMPIVSGVVMAYILNIMMVWFEKRLWPNSQKNIAKQSRRPMAIVLALLTITLIFIFVLGLVIPQLYKVFSEAVKAVPLLIERFQAWMGDVEQWLPDESKQFLGNYQADLDNIMNKIMDFRNVFFTNILSTTLSTVGSLTMVIVNGVLSLMIAIYVLMSKERLIDQFIRITTTYLARPTYRRIFYVLTSLDFAFKRFFTAELINSVILGLMVTLGMWVFNFPYAGMIGALTGVFALVPMIGAYLSGAIGMILISVHSIPQAFWFLLFMIFVQQFSGNVIFPKIIGDSLGMPGMWVLVAVTFGGGLMGVPGMIIGVPLASAIYIMIKRDVSERENLTRQERDQLIRDARHDSFKKVTDDQINQNLKASPLIDINNK